MEYLAKYSYQLIYIGTDQTLHQSYECAMGINSRGTTASRSKDVHHQPGWRAPPFSRSLLKAVVPRDLILWHIRSSDEGSSQSQNILAGKNMLLNNHIHNPHIDITIKWKNELRHSFTGYFLLKHNICKNGFNALQLLYCYIYDSIHEFIGLSDLLLPQGQVIYIFTTQYITLLPLLDVVYCLLWCTKLPFLGLQLHMVMVNSDRDL